MTKEEERLNKKYDKIVYKELNKMAHSAVKEFYDSRKPKRYLRKYDLYNSYQIITRNGKWSIKIGFEFMKKDHSGKGKEGTENKPVSNKYIYWQTMLMGAHGGAYREDIPKPDFYWRKPYPDYTEWWPSPAPRYQPDGAANMEEYILDWADRIMDYQWEQRQKEYEQKMDPIFADLLDRLNRL